MQYNLIVAHELNYGIGKDGQIPWNIPIELRHFKETTENHVVIMGGKTATSLGKSLKNRTNIVISKSNLNIVKKIYGMMGYNYINHKSLWHKGFLLVDSPETACKVCENISPNKPCFVIGGAQIYNWFLEKDLIDELIMTQVGFHRGCDTFFDKKFLDNYVKYDYKTINVSMMSDLIVRYYRRKNE